MLGVGWGGGVDYSALQLKHIDTYFNFSSTWMSLTYKQVMSDPLFTNTSVLFTPHTYMYSYSHKRNTHTVSLSGEPQTVGGCQPFLMLTASLVQHALKDI